MWSSFASPGWLATNECNIHVSLGYTLVIFHLPLNFLESYRKAFDLSIWDVIWTSEVKGKITGQPRPHKNGSIEKQLRLEILDVRAWLGKHGMSFWETDAIDVLKNLFRPNLFKHAAVVTIRLRGKSHTGYQKLCDHQDCGSWNLH